MPFVVGALALIPQSAIRTPRYTTVTVGTVPVVISAPHGGRRRLPGVPDRAGEGVAKFVTVRDTNTQELAAELVLALEAELGGKPFAVVAGFPRTQVDANRPPEAAAEDARAVPVYDHYHSALRAHCRAVRARWGRGLLLDLHGQAADAGVVFRGTQGGRTVADLTARFGRPALVGPDSVLGGLAAKGYRVHPPLGDRTAREDPRFGGGYIVRTYGSDAGTGIDAIQLELGGDHRARAALKRTAADLAAAVGRFARAYLP